MTSGRVVVVKEYKQPFVIEEYEVPDPEPGGMVLKITQAGICGSDLHTLARRPGQHAPAGERPGDGPRGHRHH